jgi:hypothetical protein
MYNKYGKENTEKDEDEDVKGTYILLSGTLAVVVHLLLGVPQDRLLWMLDVDCIQKHITVYDYNPPTLHRINARTRHYSFLHG